MKEVVVPGLSGLCATGQQLWSRIAFRDGFAVQQTIDQELFFRIVSTDGNYGKLNLKLNLQSDLYAAEPLRLDLHFFRIRKLQPLRIVPKLLLVVAW